MHIALSCDLHRVIIAYFVASSIICLAILYFMAPAALQFAGINANATMYSNLVLGCFLLLLSKADTVVIPKQYRTGLRSVATMLLFANIDNAICVTHALVKADSVPPDEKARGALRFSTAMIILNSVLVFLYTYFKVPESSPFTMAPTSVLASRFFRVLTVVLLVVAQILAWSMTNMCNSVLPTVRQFPGFTTIGYAALFTAGTLLDDREAFDFAFIFITNYVFTSGPIFDSTIADPDQSAFYGLWQGNVACRFAASLLAGLSVLIPLLGQSGLNLSLQTLLSVRGAVQGGLCILGLAGAICVYVKSPSGVSGSQLNWNFSFAWILPLLSIIFHITSVEYFRGVAFILSLPVLGLLGTQTKTSVSVSYGGGYLNAGEVMCFFAVLASPVLDIVMERPFGLRPINEYFSDNFPTVAGGTSALPADKASEVSRKFFIAASIFVYLAASDFAGASASASFSLQLLTGIYMFLGNECKIPDLHRILFFQAIPTLFSSTLWPLLSQTNTVTFLTFFILGWFAFHYIARYEDPTLQMTSGDRLYEVEQPFIPTKQVDEGYQRVPSGGPTERSSLLSSAPPPRRSEAHVEEGAPPAGHGEAESKFDP